MSTKRAAVLLAKDRCLLSSKAIQDGQYNSINLNHHKKCDETVKLLQSEIISKDIPKRNGFVDYNSSSGKNVSNLWKKNGISKSYMQECSYQEKEENKWQNKGEMNKSTLSLHIAAYENGIENQNIDSSLGKGFEQETFASETLKNSFDFPRQFQESMKPEMMQFKSSQKLMNFKATGVRSASHGHHHEDAKIERKPENYRPGSDSYAYENPWPKLNGGRLDWLFQDGWRRPLAKDQGAKMRREWLWFGKVAHDEHSDWYRFHYMTFFAFTVFTMWITWWIMVLRPDWPQGNEWALREAHLEIVRRKKAGLPLISKDLIDPQRVALSLPSEEEIRDFEILI